MNRHERESATALWRETNRLAESLAGSLAPSKANARIRQFHDLIAGFALVWIANIYYLGLFARIRLDLRKERAEIGTEEAILLHTHV